MGNSPEHYFKTQKAISKSVRLIQKIIRCNGDFIQSYIRYTIIITSQYLWKFHSLLFTKPGSLLLPPPLFSKPVAPPPPPPPPPPPSNTPLEEACSATQNTLINMKEATN